ncbi:MAG: N-acetylneuraminate synthase family protein [Chloroflexota bacterium]
MVIEKDLSKYVINTQESIMNALKKIVDTKGRVVFAVTDMGILEGLCTNGDFLRWAVKQEDIDLNQPVSVILNQNYTYATIDEPPEKIEIKLKANILYVPILDHRKRLVAIARQRSKGEGVTIGDFVIDETSSTFIIAEIGVNHNGSLDIAKRMIDLAAEAGADCAKFQMRHLETLYKDTANTNAENLGAQYQIDILSRFQLTPEEMFAAFDHCKQQGILPLCTPWDTESIIALEKYGMPAYKVASADLTNHDLLAEIAKTGKPMICSTGMSNEVEIIESASLLRRLGAQYVLLQCNSTYPAPFKDINLKYMDRLREIGDCPVGYSGHERGANIAIAAVARGAKVIEKHFTIDRDMEGNDHKVSLLPDEFKIMVEGIRQVEESLGTAGERRMSQGELRNRADLAKSLIINCNLEPGETIHAEMIEIKSPGRGLQPNRKSEIIGIKAARRFKSGDFFYPSDLPQKQNTADARHYQVKRKWGVPVRYYDFKTLMKKSNPDFIEFHLSYKDMDQDFHKFVDQTYDLDFTVHSPDLFTGDHLLNPCHPDKSYRERSLKELQRVIDLTRELKPFFKRATTPLIITSVGGFTRDRLLHPSERPEFYERLAENLAILDTEGVEIIPQTLPPFPWYLGGQLYLNLFVDPTDTAEFCEKYGYRLCLDVSHGVLTCNQFKLSFKEYIEQLGPYTAHLHIADTEGVDGEGLQIGAGDTDFPALAEDLDRVAPNASFIPEIWQGHENEGEGFWIAMERLEGLF